MEKYVCVCGWEYDPRWAIPTAASPPAPPLPISPTTGCAPCAAWGRTRSLPRNQNAQRPEPKGSGLLPPHLTAGGGPW